MIMKIQTKYAKIRLFDIIIMVFVVQKAWYLHCYKKNSLGYLNFCNSHFEFQQIWYKMGYLGKRMILHPAETQLPE